MVRIKHRYLLLNILYPNSAPQQKGKDNGKDLPWTVTFRRPSPDRLNMALLARMIRDSVVELFGDYGAGMVAGSLQVKYLSSATSTAIVRVSRAHYRLVWAALSFVTHIPGGRAERCVVQVVRVSGTIKKVEEEAVRLARKSIVRARKGVGELEDDVDADAQVPMRIDSDGSGDEGRGERRVRSLR